ncbi:MAG: LCP family protein [Lachnospiraceae bacterium]|nr:LCP family protein [Lachnospiraceae bacterium]
MDNQLTEYELRRRKQQRIAQKKKKAAKRRRRKILIFMAELMVFFVVVVALFGITKWDKIQKPSFTKNEIKVNEDINEDVLEVMKGYSTYVLFGVDARDRDQLDKGIHSDTIMIVSVDHDTGDIRIVSVFRDTYLCVSEEDKFGKINGAYMTGGPLNAINMLNRNFDLSIDGYVTVNWYALAKTIDLLGGVEVNITEDMINNPKHGNMLNGYIIETSQSTGVPSMGVDKPGLQTLNGIQAVAYSRIRYVSGGDYTRTEHQREVVGLMFEKAKKMSFGQLNSIIDEVLPNISTNIDIGEALSLAKLITKYNIIMGEGFPYEKTTKRIPELNNADCVLTIDFASNVARMHDALYGSGASYVPSSEVQRIQKIIEKQID